MEEGGKKPNKKHSEKHNHKSHRHVRASLEESDLPSLTKKPSTGEKPGREEGESGEPQTSIVIGAQAQGSYFPSS